MTTAAVLPRVLAVEDLEFRRLKAQAFRLVGGETMPQFFIQATNSKFRSRDEGAEYDHPDAAMALGIRSAIALIADEVNRGERSAAVEISIEGVNGIQVLRSVVAVSVSPMILAAHPFKLTVV